MNVSDKGCRDVSTLPEVYKICQMLKCPQPLSCEMVLHMLSKGNKMTVRIMIVHDEPLSEKPIFVYKYYSGVEARQIDSIAPGDSQVYNLYDGFDIKVSEKYEPK